MDISEEQKLRLEMLVTEHERVLEQFSGLIQDQQSQIDRLNSRVKLLEEKLSKYDEADEGGPAQEPPPHY